MLSCNCTMPNLYGPQICENCSNYVNYYGKNKIKFIIDPEKCWPIPHPIVKHRITETYENGELVERIIEDI
jgi:hypothetical protein